VREKQGGSMSGAAFVAMLFYSSPFSVAVSQAKCPHWHACPEE